LIKNHPNKNFKINIVSSKLCDSMSWLDSYTPYYLYSALYSTKDNISFVTEEAQILQEHFPHLEVKQLHIYTNAQRNLTL
jgi:hypothetical protein